MESDLIRLLVSIFQVYIHWHLPRLGHREDLRMHNAQRSLLSVCNECLSGDKISRKLIKQLVLTSLCGLAPHPLFLSTKCNCARLRADTLSKTPPVSACKNECKPMPPKKENQNWRLSLLRKQSSIRRRGIASALMELAAQQSGSEETVGCLKPRNKTYSPSYEAQET